MGNEIRNLAIVLAIFGFGWWLVNRQAQTQSPVPIPATPTPATPSPTTTTDIPLLTKKFNLSACASAASGTAIRASKAQCITVGSKHGVIMTMPDGQRCTLGCATFSRLTASEKKKMGADKCKCTVADRTELEAELVKSSYTSFRVTIA